MKTIIPGFVENNVKLPSMKNEEKND
jgi:hypothetical protein